MPVAAVTDVTTGFYRIPTSEALEDATQTFDTLELVVVRVDTSAGVHGIGVTYTIGEGGASILRFLDDVLVPESRGKPSHRVPAGRTCERR